MRKTIILILPILLLTGCRANLDGREDAEDDSCLEIYCDKKYNVEYIRDVCWRHGGITVRLDNKGNIIKCNGE